MKISPETWKKLEPLLTNGLEMSPAERATWIEGVRTSHPDVAPLLAKMLATHDEAERARDLETVPKLFPPPTSPFTPGDAIGPYRLLRPVGKGGMGEVWLAEQADGRLDRQVALKLPRSLEAGDIRAERFRRERDILAKLVHPNIARLYDAGASAAGQPYLAMEFVEGVPLDQFVAREKLTTPARLALIRQVLAAVADAHRHLVVHRDLKPANILIDGAGQVKLLDFGIAKLVDDGVATAGGPARDLTGIGGRVLTLRYAAPEQVAEGTITTATDIYSLGVVLHELLTGKSPYRAVRDSKPLTDLMLVQEEIGPPSALVKELSGDLDAIVLKAMRRDPSQRYATVEAFDEDIRRHLEQRPVLARAGTWRYLAGRFARRHRLAIAMAAAVVTMTAVGIVLIERERRVAVAERARAERHFESVRKLANTFIFDVHGEVAKLAGSLKAREMLVRTSLDYLSALAGEAGDNPELQFELAAAYRRIAAIQGEAGAANAGETAAAIANLEKAARLLADRDRARPDDRSGLREQSQVAYTLARAYFVTGDARWQAEIERAAGTARRVAALPGATPHDRSRAPAMASEQAALTALMKGSRDEWVLVADGAVESLEALAREHPSDVSVRLSLLKSLQNASSIRERGELQPENDRRIVALRRKSLELARQLSDESPENQELRARVVAGVLDLAAALGRVADHAAASALVDEALALGGARLAIDPRNADVMQDHLRSLAEAAKIRRRAGDLDGAIVAGREAVAFVARLPEEFRRSRDVRNLVAESRVYLGYALLAAASAPSLGATRRLALLREARPLLANGVAFLAEVRSENLGVVRDEDVKELEVALKSCDDAIRRHSSRR